MTPVCACLRKVDHASAAADTSILGGIAEALDELEAAYGRPSERIVALEEVLQNISRRESGNATPFGRFVRVSVERRQNRLARRRA